jgi:hypothetical protein
MDVGTESLGWTDDSVLPVSVIVGRAADPAEADEARVLGIVVGERFASGEVRSMRMRSGPEGHIHMWLGFRLRLHKAQVEDYALNINSPTPVAFVAGGADEETGFRPSEVTVSLAEAQKLDRTELRGTEESVHRVPMPPEVFRWVERFVLEHYVPRKRKARGKRRSKAVYDAEVGDWAEDVT